MADNRRNRPGYSDDDAHTPKPNEPSDPLAELARLIGQSDPFTDTARSARTGPDRFRAGDRPAPDLRATPDSRAAPEWLSRPSSTPARDPYDPPPAPRYADDARYQDDPHDDSAAHQDDGYADYPDEHAEAQDYRHDDRYRVAPPPPVDYDNDGYYAEDGHMPPEGEDNYTPPRRRGGLMTIVAVLGLAVIGTAGAFAYRSFTGAPTGSATPPVIKADPSPAKIVPPSPTAANDAQNKPFQDRVAGGTAERVVPREEQPVSLPVPPRPTVANPQTAFAPSSASANAVQMVPPPAATTPANNEPRRVKTQVIRPQDLADPAAQPQQQAAAPPATRSVAPPPTAPTPAAPGPAAKQPSGPMAIAPQSDTPASRAKLAVRTPPAQPARAGYAVQLSSQKTEEDARSSYEVMQQKYPNVLGGRDAAIRRVDLPNETRYRVRIETFVTMEQATSFCNSLKEAGGQCLPVKN
jgi:hypothetical protein